MPEKVPQTFANHPRLDPPYHYFLLPLTAINILVAIGNLVVHPGFAAAWFLLLALAAAPAVLKIRLYALKVQDHVIRLEERLRLAAVLPEPLQGRIAELTEGQFVALRFASDRELPALVEKTLAGNLQNAEIKKLIQDWRPDYFRV